MTYITKSFNNFVGGEVSQDMFGRYDLDIYNKACEAMLNFIIKAQGPASYRPGFKFLNSTRKNKVANTKEFIFNDAQAYVLEFTDLKLRFIKDQIPVKEAAKNITGVSIAAQAVITSVAHGYSNDDEIFIYDIVGPDSLNGKSYFISDKTTDNYKIKDVDGNYISTVGMSAYSSGGTSERIYEVTTPYAEAEDLNKIQVAQNADTMYIAHPSYQPMKLTRSTSISWTLATFTGTSFPFTTTNNFPAAVAFAQGRLWYGGTNNAVNKFWGSKAPQNDGTNRYDDYTTGTAADDAVVFTMALPSGKVEAIKWMAANDRYILIGTYGGVSKVTGTQDGEAITPTGVNVRQLTSYGCYPSVPVALGSRTFYIQRSGLVLRELKYNLAEDTYVPEDRNLITPRIVGTGIQEIKYASGRPDILWGARLDGKLLGITTDKGENISGWHRHNIGGDGIVESLAVVPRANQEDQVYTVIKRTINGKVRRYHEYMADEVVFPSFLDFYTGDKIGDDVRYGNVVYTKQRDCKHLDSHLTFNGSDYGYVKDATLSISVALEIATITSDVAVFENSDIGREISGVYDSAGFGGGRYLIKSITSTQIVVCELLVAPDTYDDLTPGNWFLSTNTISGLEHLEGEAVGVVANGGSHIDAVVSAGRITLDAQYSVVHVGYLYQGVLKSLGIEGGGINGSSQAKHKRILEIAVRFADTLGAEVGTDIYRLEKVNSANTDQIMGRPPRPCNNLKKIPVPAVWGGDKPDDVDTRVVVVQNLPLPCTVQAIHASMEVVNE